MQATVKKILEGRGHRWKRAVRAHSPVLVCSVCEDVWWPGQNLADQRQCPGGVGIAKKINSPIDPDRWLAITQWEMGSAENTQWETGSAENEPE